MIHMKLNTTIVINCVNEMSSVYTVWYEVLFGITCLFKIFNIRIVIGIVPQFIIDL